MGCMAILMLHHLTGGWWGYPNRRLLEAGTRTFLPMAILFIPVLLGMTELYRGRSWSRGRQTQSGSPIQATYLNLPFFTVRAVIYFAIWLTSPTS